jgi:putative membrane protein
MRAHKEPFRPPPIQSNNGTNVASAAAGREEMMLLKFALLGAAAIVGVGTPALAAAGPTDPQIAHIAYTAGSIDIAAAKQALAKSHNASVHAFAQEMVRDHKAVNDRALALVKMLKVTPKSNATSEALTKQANTAMKRLAALRGAAFDRAYIENEIAFHKTVNGALESTLIPSAHNAELKSLLKTGLTLFREHQVHAEHVATEMN